MSKLLVVVLGLWGCGNKGAVPTAEQLVGAYCDLAFRCCNAGELAFFLGPYVTQENCVSRYVEASKFKTGTTFALPIGQTRIQLVNLGQVDRLVHEKRTSVDEEKIRACLDFLQGMSCGSPPDMAQPAPTTCKSVLSVDTNPCNDPLFVGLIDRGEKCTTFDFECKPDLICTTNSSSPGEGTCVERHTLGDLCFTTFECQTPLYCSQLDGTCQERRKVGEECQYGDPAAATPTPNSLLIECELGATCDPLSKTCVLPCTKGAACINDTQCDKAAGLRCIAKRCDMPRGVGGICDDDGDCTAELRCTFDVAINPRFSHCVARVPIGQSCVSDGQCVSNAYCPSLTNLCTQKLSPPSLCTGDNQCAGYCDSTIIPCSGDPAPCPSGMCNVALARCASSCAPSRADGVACTLNNQCMSRACASGTCRTLPLSDGTACSSSSQCASNFCNYEVMRTCARLPLLVGAYCVSGAECVTGVCFKGVCASGSSAGIPCGDPAQTPCAADFFCDVSLVPAICQPKVETGGACKNDLQCRGECQTNFGRSMCDPTPAPGKAICSP